MASVVTLDGSPSEEAFMEVIIFQNHPEYKELPRVTRRWVLKQARKGSFQLSHLLEQAVALRSQEIRSVPLANTNADGMDFDEGSDLKSFSLNIRTNGKGGMGAKGVIGGVANKVGAIRGIMYNAVTQDVEYYFIPKEAVEELQTGGRIDFTAPKDTGVVKKLQPYRCDSFDDLVLS